MIEDYVAWTVGPDPGRWASRSSMPVRRAAFKENVRTFSLDDVVPSYGVSSRNIVGDLCRRRWASKSLPHPLHVHCGNLGAPGSADTGRGHHRRGGRPAAASRPSPVLRLRHRGKRKFSSDGARAWRELVNATPEVTIDISQVMFGQTVTLIFGRDASVPGARHRSSEEIGDLGWRRQWRRHRAYRYRAGLPTVRWPWATGLELFLLITDPWRVFFTTDHPNGAPFTVLPKAVRAADAQRRPQRDGLDPVEVCTLVFERCADLAVSGRHATRAAQIGRPEPHGWGECRARRLVYFGGSLYIDDGRATAKEIYRTVQNAAEVRPTIFFGVPLVYQLIAPILKADGALRRGFFERLQMLFYAGGMIPDGVWNDLRSMMVETRGAHVYTCGGYGATEMSPSVLLSSWDAGRPGIVGLPVPGVAVKLTPVGDKLECA